MEIDANMNGGFVSGVTSSKRSGPAAATTAASGTDSFSSSTALDSLQSAPDSRAEAVARGRALVAQDGYPPSTTLQKLSGFLANKLSNSAAPTE